MMHIMYKTMTEASHHILLIYRWKTWWRHQMEIFSALLAICAGNSPVPGEFPTQRPVTRSFDVFFDLRPSKRLSKQSWGWWFETQSFPLWRHCNDIAGRTPIRVGPSADHQQTQCFLHSFQYTNQIFGWHQHDRGKSWTVVFPFRFRNKWQ